MIIKLQRKNTQAINTGKNRIGAGLLLVLNTIDLIGNREKIALILKDKVIHISMVYPLSALVVRRKDTPSIKQSQLFKMLRVQLIIYLEEKHQLWDLAVAGMAIRIKLQVL